MYDPNLKSFCGIFQVLHKYSPVSSAVRKQYYFHSSAGSMPACTMGRSDYVK